MEATATIQNEEGLHARPAGILAKRASSFKSKIEIQYGDVTKNAKSIMSLMSLGLKSQAQVKVIANGEDEKEAVDAIVAMINNRFQDAP